MPFIATRTLRECLPTGEVVTHEMGATLTRFRDWNYAVQAALLRRQDVVEAKEEADAGAGSTPAPAVAVRLPDAAAPATTPVDPEPPAADGLSCPHCPGKVFANRQGLRLHTTRMHKARA